ncbi:MAG TPA: nuclear transport factor 2 family protein, partial [Steroidobacteraceae bacterium]|nr:nuclear transport factor 2 family protein [Steroidobacteraceae bacterium]
RVVRRFFELNTRVMSGEPADIFSLLHEDLVWTMTGSTPVARTYHGLQEFKDIIGRALGTQFRPDPGFGLYPCKIIASGNRAAVIARGHGESALGRPYNNQYFFFMEVRDGKIASVLESCDGSLVWQSVFGRHLEPGPSEP